MTRRSNPDGWLAFVSSQARREGNGWAAGGWVALPPAIDALTLYVASESAGSATVSIPGLTPTPFSENLTLSAGGSDARDHAKCRSGRLGDGDDG